MGGIQEIPIVEKDKEEARSQVWRLSSNPKDKNWKPESDASKEVEKAGVVGLGSKSEEHTEQGASRSRVSVQIQMGTKNNPFVDPTCFEAVFLEWQAPGGTVAAHLWVMSRRHTAVKESEERKPHRLHRFGHDTIIFLRKQLYF